MTEAAAATDDQPLHILCVDDDPINLELIKNHLDKTRYVPVLAHNGTSALELLEASPDAFDAVLLDWMMPDMNGYEVLLKIKANPKLKFIPVILQTAKAEVDDILKCMHAGAYYYIPKPFDKNQVVSVLRAALKIREEIISLKGNLEQRARATNLLQEGTFCFRSVDEAHDLAATLAASLPNPDTVGLGLVELMVNAVEHGNLGIGYKEKGKLNEEGKWYDEVARRLELPEFCDKYVQVSLTRTDHETNISIKDQGTGFDWNNFLEIHPDRVFDSHGRGIAMANGMCFTAMVYNSPGNEVSVTISHE